MQLRPEWSPTDCVRSTPVDVNLGNSPASFVTAAYCQVTGALPPDATVTALVNLLLSQPWIRRIDIVQKLCVEDPIRRGNCQYSYSSPWINPTPVSLSAPCNRKTTVQFGTVMMFFFGCPDTLNCKSANGGNPFFNTWANTHAWGMYQYDATYNFTGLSGTWWPTSQTGYYNPANVDFWARELQDARYAGFQFVLPNVYGPDIIRDNVFVVNRINRALDTIGGGILVGLYDDPSRWGQDAPPYEIALGPTFPYGAEDAARRIFTSKWKPWFQGIRPQYWFNMTANRPLIVFYNAGPDFVQHDIKELLWWLKLLFQQTFNGVVPYLSVDGGYAEDLFYNGQNQADIRFGWDSLQYHNTQPPDPPLFVYTDPANGITQNSFMVKWDSWGRDQPNATSWTLATTDGKNGPHSTIKDASILNQVDQHECMCRSTLHKPLSGRGGGRESVGMEGGRGREEGGGE